MVYSITVIDDTIILFISVVEVGFDPVSYTVKEGESTDLIILRRGDAEGDVEVTLSTVDNTATGNLCWILNYFCYIVFICYVLVPAGQDYSGLSGVSVVFQPGVNERRVLFSSLTDNIIENIENLTATITASSGSGVVITAPEATVSITESIGM